MCGSPPDPVVFGMLNILGWEYDLQRSANPWISTYFGFSANPGLTGFYGFAWSRLDLQIQRIQDSLDSQNCNCSEFWSH